MKLSIIIPAYNEEKTIGTVLKRVLKFLPEVHEVIVVDDSSTDLTRAQCEQFASQEQRVRLLLHPKNSGKTAALKTGIAQVTGDVVVVQDADLEYDPSEIPALIDPILNGDADACLGSRFMIRKAGRVLYYRHYLANKFLTFLSNVLTDLNVTDVETGYKAIKAEILRPMIIESSGFGFEIEVVAKLSKWGARIYEVPVSYYGRTYAEGKKIGLKDGIDAILYVLKFNLLRSRKTSFRV